MKKFIVLMLCLLVAAGSVFASGSSEAASAEENSNTVKVLLTYPSDKKVLYSCFDDFTAETGIDVEIIYMPLADSRKQISIMVAGNDLPDVLDVDNPDIANYAQMGILADITDRVNSEIEIDQYYPATLATCQYDGKYHGLPFTSNNLGILYNTDLFAQAGIEKFPETWDEFLETCAQLKAAGIQPFSVSGMQHSDTTFQMWPFLWTAGVDYTKINSPETIKVLNFYKTLVDNGYLPKDVVQNDANANGSLFVSGRVAMVVDGPWRISAIRNGNPDLNFAVAPIPDGGNGVVTALGGHNFAVTNGNNVDNAWEFVKFMNRPDIMAKYSEAENYIPSRRDVCESTEYFQQDPIRIFAENEANARQLPTKNYSKLSEQINLMWQSVVLGTKTPEQAAADAEAAIAPLL